LGILALVDKETIPASIAEVVELEKI